LFPFTHLVFFRREKLEDEISKEEKNPQPHVDLSFKEGQTIKINLGVCFTFRLMIQNIFVRIIKTNNCAIFKVNIFIFLLYLRAEMFMGGPGTYLKGLEHPLPDRG